MARNTAMILDHFGFGSLVWPTQEDLLPIYGMKNKQAVSAAEKNYYFDRVKAGPLAGPSRVAAIVTSRTFWLETDLLAEIEAQGITGLPQTAGLLLDYLKTQSLARDHVWTLPNLSPATRESYVRAETRFVLHKDAHKALAKYLDDARKVAGNSGIGEIRTVPAKHAADHPDITAEVLKHVIRHDPDVWICERGDEFWFTFDGWRNRLANATAKAFAAVSLCDARLLSTLLVNALADERPRYRYPDQDIVLRWILSGPNFRREGPEVAYLGTTDLLTREERILRDILLKSPGARGPALTREMMARTALQDAMAGRYFYHSPLVFVDRSEGEKLATYHFITDAQKSWQQLRSPAAADAEAPSPADLRRAALRKALAELGETDGSTSARYRKEQSRLAALLFDQDTHGLCAICQRNFGVSALVAAHKKKRKDCSEEERRDPDIVFPLCVFGCDHLYETRQLIIRDGIVAAGTQASGPAEAAAIATLLGGRIDSRWLQGPATYFASAAEDTDAADPATRQAQNPLPPGEESSSPPLRPRNALALPRAAARGLTEPMPRPGMRE
ncbi:hypothetical protein [Rubellimicrobium mesophilum]|uniref:hypothetical protein n=1 Tax=Rubellimicrobium mesophilum TaxID=1123067 RepID=UPI0012E1ECCF|nr:hypothetical protein [Rubellimicrobium mesophilum]